MILKIALILSLLPVSANGFNFSPVISAKIYDLFHALSFFKNAPNVFSPSFAFTLLDTLLFALFDAALFRFE